MRCICKFEKAGTVKQTILAVSACLFLAGSVRANIIISEVDSAGSGSSSGYLGDWFELTNTGASAVNISGWKVDDNSDSFGAALTLTGISSIAAGQSVVFFETTVAGSSTSNFLAAWGLPGTFPLGTYNGGGAGLSQSGDHVNIFDSLGVLQANVIFNAPTGTATFDNSAGLNGVTISAPSVVGVNGAYTATNGEIGSPGTIGVPEPASALLVVLSAVGLMVSRSVRCRARS
jgi:hypothetical protein